MDQERPGRYYWTLFLDAHRKAADWWERVAVIVGYALVVVAAVSPAVAANLRVAGWLTAHPWLPIIAALALFLAAVGRENWRRVVQVRQRVAGLQQQKSDKLDACLAFARKWKHFLFSPVETDDDRFRWFERVQEFQPEFRVEVQPHLTPVEINRFMLVEVEVPLIELRSREDYTRMNLQGQANQVRTMLQVLDRIIEETDASLNKHRLP